jgi:molecular chaperone GrpE
MADELNKKDTSKQVDDIDKESMDEVTQSTDSEDVTFEESDEEGGVDLQAKVKKLKRDLKKAEAEKLDYLAGWKRAQADLVNARKRDEEDKKQFTKYVNEGLISELFPVLDSFYMAFQNKEAWEKVDKNWRTGVEYIYSQLIGVLEQNKLKILNPKGETFDPSQHIAIENVPVEDKNLDNKILEVVQNGFELSGKVIREPKVKVGELKQ